MSGASAWIESCEVAGNRVMYGGGGIYIEGPGVTVVNSIIQGNESAYWGAGCIARIMQQQRHRA